MRTIAAVPPSFITFGGDISLDGFNANDWKVYDQETAIWRGTRIEIAGPIQPLPTLPFVCRTATTHVALDADEDQRRKHATGLRIPCYEIDRVTTVVGREM